MLKVYNTLTRRREIFRPLRGKTVRMFVCGPTVYDFAHIGHGRTYLVFDLIATYLRVCGFRVRYVINITDVDDKIISRAAQRKQPCKDLAREFERAYLKDMAWLGIASVRRYARATDFIPQIVAQVRLLLQKGAAYRIENDGIYFNLGSFPRYGRLANRTAQDAEDAVSRIDESSKKRNRGDFCLWKFSKPGLSAEASAKAGEPVWKTVLGPGRPGWHIEDTAITHTLFGPQYDLHGGAIDLIFPHHEAEIAQMETAYGKRPMARYWMHSGFLNVGGEKMSKSLGNFITIRDLLSDWPPEVFRFFVFSTHYRSSIDYSTELLTQAAASRARIREFLQRVHTTRTKISAAGKQNRTAIKSAIIKTRRRFYSALDDDFDTPKALAALFAFIRTANPVLEKGIVSRNDHKAIVAFFIEVNRLLKIFTEEELRGASPTVPEAIEKLVAQRESMRHEKRFAEADALRQKVLTAGWTIEDTARGPRVKKT